MRPVYSPFFFLNDTPTTEIYPLSLPDALPIWTGPRGRMRLQCATPSCASAPGDWVYFNPLLFATFKIPTAKPRPSHHDEVSSAAAKYRRTENPEAPGAHGRYSAWFRAVLARLRMLRPLAADLHPIHPVG